MTTPAPPASEADKPETPSDFIRDRITQDVRAGKNQGHVVTRFPPEPNGYLHIGHAKSICLNFGVANEFENARCHLRFDDTNPAKEDAEYVKAIQDDVRWLGFDWGDRLYYASNYFDRLYECATLLIKNGKAYVCDQSPEEFKRDRGTPTTPGTDSPYRTRSAEENLELFARMRNGEFPDGSRTLRAKIDMASPNIHMRDPALYRIRAIAHHRTGDAWPIYPTYDFTHCLSDSFEGVTHSLCTLEFEVHRPLYDWVVEHCEQPWRPQQIEFARLNLSYTVLSKRKLLTLVESGAVSGWDDPRMPTISGLRRRGCPPEAVREFCARIGVTKFDGLTDAALLEWAVRHDLNKRAVRRMAVLRPLRLIIENYPEGQSEPLEAVNNPEDPEAGTRSIAFSKELFIERDDFMEDPPKKFFRLGPGRSVRLKYAFIVTCVGFDKDPATGEITAVRCEYDPETKSGRPTTKKVKAAIHWVDGPTSLSADVRLYDRLLTVPDPDAEKDGKDWTAYLNPKSLETLSECRLEPALAELTPGAPCQFERLGYFCADAQDSRPERLVFNRTVTLKDAWAKAKKS